MNGRDDAVAPGEGDSFDFPAHPPVADEREGERAGGPHSGAPSRNARCNKRTALSASVSATTRERLISEAPSEIIRTLISFSASNARAAIPLRRSSPSPTMQTIAIPSSVRAWANADTPQAAATARKLGAEGIGLARTERMFNAEDRLPLVVAMIMASSSEERKSYLEKLGRMQKADFKRILREMKGLPVVIRLLDPPLHEFLPRLEDLQAEVDRLRRDGQEKELVRVKRIMDKARQLAEANPMLGHRGIRLGITNPEIYEMQMSALMEAAAELTKEGVAVRPKIMTPQVASFQEVKVVKEQFEGLKRRIESEENTPLGLRFGTMIETVRAALDADEIAKYSEFFSFGTNDLSQATFSFSREDAEAKFLPFYLEHGVLPENPFETLDEKGVGKLIKMAVESGRSTRPSLEVGICGEHGGDPRSIYLCHKVGLDYVSASPFRVPVARLAAARIAILEKKKHAA